jgi:xanthine dehydrogenase large subunit
MRVALFDVPNRADSIHRSKAVGEPPLLLGFAALLAIKDAVAACGPERHDPLLLAPATAEAVLKALS